MVLKIINATEARTGTNILIKGVPFVIKKVDISKTGKHGHSKCRIEANSIINDQKKVFVIPGHDKLEIPLVDKRKAQVLSKTNTPTGTGGKVSVMDLENFETVEINCPNKELFDQLEENNNCEYWNIEKEKIIRRKL